MIISPRPNTKSGKSASYLALAYLLIALFYISEIIYGAIHHWHFIGEDLSKLVEQPDGSMK